MLFTRLFAHTTMRCISVHLQAFIWVRRLCFQCLENVEGRRCDRCKENKFNRQLACVDCPACYNLVQDAVDKHREDLRNLTYELKEVKDNPTVISDIDFDQKLNSVLTRIEDLWRDAKDSIGGKKSSHSMSLATNLKCLKH